MEKGRFRPIETAPAWSETVFDTASELAAMLEAHAYQFAKTMPGMPHCYTLKRTWPTPGMFIGALKKMRAVERLQENFRGHWYNRFTANGYKYWTMGAALDHVLINRTAHEPFRDVYTPIAGDYDLAMHADRADVERSHRAYKQVEPAPHMSVLDIGCGTGTLIDFRYTSMRADRYTGIDPSRGMLSVFAEKHPQYRDRLIRTAFEDYWPAPNGKFDLVLAMQGAASYLGEPSFVSRKIRWMLKPGGTAILMYYREPAASRPIYERLGIRPPDEDFDRVTGPMWTCPRDEDPDWLTVVGGSAVREEGAAGA